METNWNKIKKAVPVIPYIITFVTSVILIWFTIGFCILDFDIMNWLPIGRLVILVIPMVFTFIHFAVINIDK